MFAAPSHLRRSRRRAGAALAALVLHGAVLTALTRPVTTPAPAPSAAVLSVELLRAAPPVASPVAAKAAASAARGPAHPAAGSPSPVPVPAAPQGGPPAQATAPPGPASGASLARGGAGAAGGADGDALRAVAALFACHGGGGELDPASRARCEAGRLRAAREAPAVDGVPAEKRAYYDAVTAAREDERAFRPVGAYYDPRENRGPSGARSHGMDAGFGYRCNIALGRGAAEANRRAGVRWAVPPCPLKPPVGSLTYETRAPPPPTTREQAADARDAARFDVPAAAAPPP